MPSGDWFDKLMAERDKRRARQDTPGGANKSQMFAILSEFQRDGVDLSTETGQRVLYAWLGQPTDQVCECGRKMRRFESFNQSCWTCTKQAIDREAAS